MNLLLRYRETLPTMAGHSWYERRAIVRPVIGPDEEPVVARLTKALSEPLSNLNPKFSHESKEIRLGQGRAIVFSHRDHASILSDTHENVKGLKAYTIYTNETPQRFHCAIALDFNRISRIMMGRLAMRESLWN